MTNKAQTKKKAKAKASTRQTAGAGYDFEDLTAAWLMVKMVRGVVMPGIEVTGIELQWQTEALGWGQIDDLLVKCKGQNSESRQLAISCKSNMQVTASGFPSGFMSAVWKLWQEEEPFQRERDYMMLVQRGDNQNFFPAWADLKGWCADGNTTTAAARIKASQKHQKIYDSIKNPKGMKAKFSDEDTVGLIRHLDVAYINLQLIPSEDQANSLVHCRDLLQDGSENTAKKLWEWLISKAKDKRLVGGTMRLPQLWQELVQDFSLKNHPDYASSWETIERITKDNRSLIETAMPTGFSVTREAIESDFIDRLNSNPVCVIYGSSGSGKSALVKSTLDKSFSEWQQVWFSPENLDLALAEGTRESLGLSHPIHDVLISTTKKENIIVIDAAERINPDCEKRAKQLIVNLLATNDIDKKLSEWRVIIIGQTEAWAAGKLHEVSGGFSVDPIEVSGLNPDDVRLVLHSSSHLSWLASDNDALVALSNLKTLAWVMQAETAFSKDGINEISIPVIADRLWSYWTNNKTKLQKLLVNLAEREALFERSFAISGLGLEICGALDESPAQFPLRKNKATNRYEFEHDLAADMARFQRLKEIKDDISSWAPFASNPLWHNALRMLGQLLLREKTEEGALWDVAFEEAEKSKDANPLAADILLDSLCLDPFAAHYLNERSVMLLSDNGARLNRLLKRFHHIATVPNVPTEFLKIDPSLKLYLEDSYRVPIYGRWPQIANFLAGYKQKICNLISPAVAKLCETWLTTTPLRLTSGEPTPYRKEFADLAIATARVFQLEQEKTRILFFNDREKPIYAAAFAAVNDIPNEVTEWALEMARRKPYRQDIVDAVKDFEEQRRKEEAERLRTDKAYRKKRKQLRSMSTLIPGYRELPPWPLGPQERVEQDFRKYCLQPHALVRLMLMRPQVASEVILAMIIDDAPKEKYSSSPGLDDDLGLEYDHSGYPTAYWKSPFFDFLQLNSTIALDTLLKLVNFCMERCEENYENVPHIKIATKGRKPLIYKGGSRVFAWSQENSLSNGQLYSALAALERWLCMEIDKEVDVTPVINTLLERTNSVAIIGVLINVGKYKPELFTKALQPLLGVYELYLGDDNRVENSKGWFEASVWAQKGEQIFEMAKEWVSAPYRKITLRELAVRLINEQDETASFIQMAAKKWGMPSDKKGALELRMLKAELDRINYKPVKDQQSGQIFLQCHYPDELQQDIEAFQQENNSRLQAITLPYECEQILQTSKMLTDEEAETLSAAFNVVPIEEDQESIKAIQAAIASTLSVRAPAWLNERPALASEVNDVITNIIADIGNTQEALQSPGRFMSDRSLSFVAYAITQKWIDDKDGEGHWDSAILRVLTSYDDQAVSILMGTAYRYRDHLGDRWWRILQISVFWAGLWLLGPGFNENEAIERHWARWLRWLRGRKLNVPSTIESLDLIAIANRVDRLKRSRIKRLLGTDAENHLRYHRRRLFGLETYALKQTFSWLLNDNDQLPNDNRDERLLTQKLWEFEVWRKKGSEKDDDDEKDELPSDLGYSLLQKLSKLLLITPKDEAIYIWKPVLSLGVGGHYAIEHFINGWLLEVVRCPNSNTLSQLWREMIEFALSSPNWSPSRYWYRGEQMFRQILSFNSIAFAEIEKAQIIILEMKDLYKRWADEHLSKEEDNVAAFAGFLSSKAGVSIRLDGLIWIKEALSPPNAVYWRRDETGSSLIQLLDVIVSQETQRISSDSSIRDALLSVAAHLASKQVPVALPLQEQIRRIR